MTDAIRRFAAVRPLVVLAWVLVQAAGGAHVCVFKRAWSCRLSVSHGLRALRGGIDELDQSLHESWAEEGSHNSEDSAAGAKYYRGSR